MLIISYLGEGEEFLRSRTKSGLSAQQYRQGIENLIRKKAELLSKGDGHLPRIEIHVFDTRNLVPLNRNVMAVSESEIKETFIRWIQYGERLQKEYNLHPFQNDFLKFDGFLDRPMYESMFHVIDEVSIVPKQSGSFANTMIESNVRDKKDGFCDMFEKQMGVLSNGEVTCCCFDYEGVLSIGNIRSHNLVELWYGKKAQAYRDSNRRKKLLHAFCQRCQGEVIR